MNRILAVAVTVVCTAVFADTKDAPPMMDMSKMGPAARKVADEKKVKKEIDEFFKKAEEADKKGDLDGSTALIDFPVFMATDDLKGVTESKSYSKDEYVAMMKPMFENMPKDAVTTHKRVVALLSDSLANVVDDWTMTMGKVKVQGKSASLLVKVGADWKWKTMVEAGWGGMGPPPAADAKTTAAAPKQTPPPAAAPATPPAKK